MSDEIKLTRYCRDFDLGRFKRWGEFIGTADGDKVTGERRWLVCSAVNVKAVEGGYACSLSFDPYDRIDADNWTGDAPEWIDHGALLASFMGETARSL